MSETPVRIFLTLLMLVVSQFASAQTQFFTIWPNHPDFSPLPPPNVTGVEVDYPVVVNVRNIVTNGATRASYSVRMEDGSDLLFTLHRFIDVSGFIALGSTDIQPDPNQPDSALSYTWYGLSDRKSLIVTVYQGVISATLITDNKHYVITTKTGGGQYVFRRYNPAAIPLDVATPGQAITDAELEKIEATKLTPKFFDPIKLLVLHTPSTLAAAGSQAQLNANIAEMFAQSDTAITNSNVTSFRLVNVSTSGNLSTQINYSETNTPPPGCLLGPGLCRWVGHRAFLRTDPTVQSIRNSTGADLVVMILADQLDAAGVAYTQRPNCGVDNDAGENIPGCTVGAGYNNFAVAAVSLSFATSFQVFAHETGHQMGMEHNPENGPPAPVASFVWSFGHYVSGVNETIMSLRGATGFCTSPCPRAFHYSNPNVNFINTSTPSGLVGRYNARTAAALAPAVSEFRNPVLTGLLFRSGFESLPIP